MMNKGTAVRIREHRSDPGKGLSYEARDIATLAEECNGEGWDVVDLTDGTSVYSFSVLPLTRDEENAAKLQDIGKGAYAAIAEMVAALECDYDRLEELREEAKELPSEHEVEPVVAGWIWTHAASDTGSDRFDSQEEAIHAAWSEANPDKAEELRALESAAGECESRDEAEQRIHEDPLSIEVRSGWHEPTSEPEAHGADEFRILLGTGGPATRIIGELNEHGEPTSATLQSQDWGTPWTDYREGDEETLLTYCRCFYFGEG